VKSVHAKPHAKHVARAAHRKSASPGKKKSHGRR
jgi:hypothetical protein